MYGDVIEWHRRSQLKESGQNAGGETHLNHTVNRHTTTSLQDREDVMVVDDDHEERSEQKYYGTTDDTTIELITEIQKDGCTSSIVISFFH